MADSSTTASASFDGVSPLPGEDNMVSVVSVQDISLGSDKVPEVDKEMEKLKSLHPLVQVLSLSNLEELLRIENATFDEREACSREKFIYRLTVAPELTLGVFTIVQNEHEGGKNDERGMKLLAHIVATKTDSPLVTDESIDCPREGSAQTLDKHVGHIEDGRTIAIHSLAVDPEYQKRGLGKMLMKSFLERMEHSGIADRVALICHDDLCEFYESLDFVHEGKSTASYGGGGWNDMVLEFPEVKPPQYGYPALSLED